MSLPPLISVIIPCWNGVNYLAEAIAGLKRQKVHMEIIVVDDGSTDATAELAASLGCTVCSIEHSGQPHAKNIGLSIAQGEFILFHDHDDVMRPHALDRLADVLQQKPSLTCVMAQAKDFISPELDELIKMTLEPRNKPYFGSHCTVLFRKAVFDTIGKFSEELIASDGVDIMARINAAGLTIGREPFIALDRRLHTTNCGRTRGKIMQFHGYASSLRQLLRDKNR